MSDNHDHDHHHGDDHDEHGDGYYVHAHITPIATNLKVIGALFALTGLTVLAYYVRLGEWNLAVAILIASIKAIWRRKWTSSNPCARISAIILSKPGSVGAVPARRPNMYSSVSRVSARVKSFSWKVMPFTWGAELVRSTTGDLTNRRTVPRSYP